MAEKLIIELDLEKGDVKGATTALAKAGEDAGEKSGRQFAKEFNQRAGRGIGNLAKVAAKATTVVAGLGSALATVIGVKAVQAAQVQEDAINALNSALLITKNAGLEASDGLQAFASELQQTTRFGDEVLLQNAALIQSLGDLDEQGLKRATKATTDLATALRIDLNSAAILVGKAAAGEVGSFSRYGLAIQKGANNAETFAKALTAIEQKFGGAAQRDVLTFSGSVDQLSNAFGDTFEEIGKIVTQNPKFTKAIKGLTQVFVSAGENIRAFAQDFDLFQTATNSLISFNNAVIEYVVAPFELAFNVVQVVQSGINTFVASAIAGFAQLGLGISKVLNALGVDNSLTQGLKDFAETSNQVADENLVELGSKIAGVFDFPVADKLSQKNEELRQFFNEANQIAAEQGAIRQEAQQTQLQASEQNAIGIQQVYSGVFDGLTSGVEGVENSFAAAQETVKNFSQKSGKQLQQGFAKAAGSAFASFGADLAQGKASLQSFTDALFKQLAQSAVTLGTNFILEGTAYAFSANPTLQKLAPGLISSGAALAAFGGALGAVSGGGGGASSGASAAGGSVTSGTDLAQTEELAAPETVERAQEQTQLNINVEGSLVRESELNSFIADILEEGANRNSTVIPSLRTSRA